MAKKKLTIGEQIKEARLNNDLSRAELAVKIGKSPEYIGYVENDKRAPRKFDRALLEKELKIVIEI